MDKTLWNLERMREIGRVIGDDSVVGIMSGIIVVLLVAYVISVRKKKA